MADERLTDKGLFTGTIADNDIYHMIDVSDTTGNPAGTSKGLEHSKLRSSFFGVDVVNFQYIGLSRDGSTDNTTTLQSVIDSLTGNAITLIIPYGLYRFDNRVELWNKFDVITIISDNAVLLPRMSDNLDFLRIGSSVLETTPIYPSVVDISGLTIDFTNATPTSESAGIFLDTVLGSCTIDKCLFRNFKNNNTVGLKFYNIGNNPGLGANNTDPGFNMSKCNFSNSRAVDAGSYDYDSNNTFGIGILVGSLNADASEYWTIDQSQFMNVYKGIKIRTGANGTIFNSVFQYCNPIVSGDTEAGVLEIDDSSDNEGKTSVVGCKFNHNWGTSIFSTVTNETTPMIVAHSQFLANSYLPVKISGSDRFALVDNQFDRAVTSVGLNKPTFSASSNRYMIALNCDRVEVRDNKFFYIGVNPVDYCVAFSSGTASRGNVVVGNIYSDAFTGTLGVAGLSTKGNGENSCIVQNNYIMPQTL